MSEEKTLGQVACEGAWVAWDTQYEHQRASWERAASTAITEHQRRQRDEVPEVTSTIQRLGALCVSHRHLAPTLEPAMNMLDYLGSVVGMKPPADHAGLCRRIETILNVTEWNEATFVAPLLRDCLVALGGKVGPEPGQRSYERLESLLPEEMRMSWNVTVDSLRSAWAKFEAERSV